MKRIIILFTGFMLSLQAMTQEKTDVMIFGDVKSKETKEHIPYATIFVKGTNIGTTADGSGHYKLANLPVGKLTLIAQAVGLKAQEKEVTTEKNKAVNVFFDLEDDILNLQQVVVTGTRSKHFIKDVPIRTEVITSLEIENKNACNLYQALDGTPGIRVENQCQSCNFTQVRMQGLGAEHTQVLINGQPVYSGLAGVYGLQQLSTVDIGQIEVIKGAGSALYGSSAVAGAINIVTKEPSFTPSTRVDLQFGSYNTNKFDVSSSIRNEKGNIGLSIFAQRYNEGVIDETGPGLTPDEVKHKDGISDRVATNLTNAGFGLYFNNALLKNDKLIVRGKSVFEVREGGTLTDDYYKNPFTDGTENIETDRYETDLQYNKKIGILSEINFSLAYVNHNREATNDSYLSDYMATHGDSVPDLRNMRPYLATENSLTSTLTFGTKIKNHSLLFGVQGFYDELNESGLYVVVDSVNSYYGSSYKSTGKKSAKEFGMFLQDEWAIGKNVVLVPGVRFDHHHSGEKYSTDHQVSENPVFPETSFDETSINPRLALKYELSGLIALRASVGTGFRAPYGFSEDLHLCSGSPRVWKSSALNPETSLSYNLSGDYYGEKFKISANFFRTDLKDKIGFTDADPEIAALGYDYQWKNIDDAFVHGVEFSATINLHKNLDLGADFTVNQGKYAHAREDWTGTRWENDSKYISRFPMTTGNLRLEYNGKFLNIALTGNYQGSMYIDYYNEDIDPQHGVQSKIKKTDPFMLFNARVSGKLSPFKIYAGINNIFNHIQDERHLDDAAFIYAPVYGTMFYGGIAVEIQH